MAPQSIVNKQAFRVKEFCEAFGISKTKFYDEVASRRLIVFKVGTRTLVSRRSADAWINQLELNPIVK